jgi:hypothetical protein
MPKPVLKPAVFGGELGGGGWYSHIMKSRATRPISFANLSEANVLYPGCVRFVTGALIDSSIWKTV